MYLYRKVRQAVTLASALAVIACGLQAQFRVPQPERKTPRAVGVLETFENGSRRLAPVTFFYERHYYDATFYHATPVPFTLYSDTVYEVQQYGKAIGTFTVLSATANANRNAEQIATAWFGNGRYKAAVDAATLAKKKASAHAVAHRVVLEDPSKPVLHRRAGSEGDNPVAHPTPAADTAEAEEDTERPRLQRREGSGGDSSAATQTAGQAPGGEQDSAATKAGSAGAEAGTKAGSGETSGQDSDRPKLHRRDDSGSAAASETPAATPVATSASTGSTSGSTSRASSTGAASPTAAAELTPSDDPEHPILRRGKAVQEQSGRDLPEFHPAGKHPVGKPGGATSGGAGEASVTRQVAVSDAGPSEAESLIYVCREEERKQMEASARELAEAELRRVAAQRGLVLPAAAKAASAKTAQAKSAPTKVAASTAKKKTAAEASHAVGLPELKLEEEQFVPYDLEYNNFATVVFSGRYVQQAASAQGAASTVAGEAAPGMSAPAKSWVVTVIGREDEGKLVKLYSAVSDPRELDLYPEVRLVDAVDPEGYGHYGLLFREQKRDGVSWLLGRTNGYGLQTVFETAVR